MHPKALKEKLIVHSTLFKKVWKTSKTISQPPRNH